jgi:hypothetical protein
MGRGNPILGSRGPRASERRGGVDPKDDNGEQDQSPGVRDLDPDFLAEPNYVRAVANDLGDIAYRLEAGLGDRRHFHALGVGIVDRPGEVEETQH